MWSYSCPYCRAMLNPDETIVLVGSCGEQRSLVGFHPQPGNYEVYLPPGVEPVPGSHWDFFCPVCQHDLRTDFEDTLCAIEVHTSGENHRVFFSRIAGEQATFVVSGEGLQEHHGTAAERYFATISQMKYLLY